MSLGHNMRHVRILHGKTMKEVADAIGVSAAMMSYIERGRHPATEDRLEKWCALFFFDETAIRELEPAQETPRG